MIKKELLLASWLEKLQKKWDNEEYYYDVEEATKVFKFVSKLTNDRGASRQFELLEFQFEIITEILCVKRRSDGKRKHREAHINIPRKNGKSFLRQYPKSEKFSLQKDTKNCIMDILRYIIRAGKSTTKKKLLYDADVELVILRYYIRIAYDQEYISGHTYGVAAKKLTEIGKMLGGFIKSVQS